MSNLVKKHEMTYGDEIERMGLELHQMIQTQSSIDISELYELGKKIKEFTDRETQVYCKKRNLVF